MSLLAGKTLQALIDDGLPEREGQAREGLQHLEHAHENVAGMLLLRTRGKTKEHDERATPYLKVLTKNSIKAVLDAILEVLNQALLGTNPGSIVLEQHTGVLLTAVYL